MPISKTDLRTSVFQIGTYSPLGPGMTVLRTEGGAALGTGLPPENQHLVTHNGIVSYNVTPSPTAPGMKVVNFGAATGHNQAAYLPYKDNNISSIRFDNSVNRFFTDNLSGCSVFVDRMPNGDIVVYHANVQGGAYKPSVEQSLDARYEKELAVAVKKQFHKNAKGAVYGGAQRIGSLFKNQYNRDAARFVNLSRFAGHDVMALGTTVVGFKTGAGWEFWYQTWARDHNNQYSVRCSEQFA